MKMVSQLMAEKSHRVEVIPPNMNVFDALKLMVDKDIGSLLVVEFGDLKGIFTERDYARKLVLQGKNSHHTLVRDVMSKELTLVTPGDTLEHCMRIVTERRIRHLPVVENGQLLDLLSIGDLVKAALAEQAATIAQLEAYIST
jgi:CBS domain-containing protein